MSGQKKIVIQVSKEKLDLINRLGFSPQYVFSKGLEEILKEKYREFSLLDEDEEDEPEWYEFIELTNPMSNIDRFLVREDEFDNT